MLRVSAVRHRGMVSVMVGILFGVAIAPSAPGATDSTEFVLPDALASSAVGDRVRFLTGDVASLDDVAGLEAEYSLVFTVGCLINLASVEEQRRAIVSLAARVSQRIRPRHRCGYFSAYWKATYPPIESPSRTIGSSTWSESSRAARSSAKSSMLIAPPGGFASTGLWPKPRSSARSQWSGPTTQAVFTWICSGLNQP